MRLINRDQISLPVGDVDIRVEGLSLSEVTWIIETWSREEPRHWTRFNIEVSDHNNVTLDIRFDEDWEDINFQNRFIEDN